MPIFLFDIIILGQSRRAVTQNACGTKRLGEPGKKTYSLRWMMFFLLAFGNIVSANLRSMTRRFLTICIRLAFDKNTTGTTFHLLFKLSNILFCLSGVPFC